MIIEGLIYQVYRISLSTEETIEYTELYLMKCPNGSF